MPVKGKNRSQGSQPDAADIQVEPVAGFSGEQASVRKPSGSKVSLSQPIRRHIGKFASTFCKKHGFMDRPTAECIARLIRISITPRIARGRKPTQTVITAARLLRQKVPWSEIYPVAIPGYGDMPKFDADSGGSRSAFRDDADHDSGMKPISVPTRCRSLIGHFRNRDRDVGIGLRRPPATP